MKLEGAPESGPQSTQAIAGIRERCCKWVYMDKYTSAAAPAGGHAQSSGNQPADTLILALRPHPPPLQGGEKIETPIV